MIGRACGAVFGALLGLVTFGAASLAVAVLVALLLGGCSLVPVSSPAPVKVIAAESAEAGPIPVYSRDECIGPVVGGVCRGAILPKRAHRPKCHGTMIFGKCTGPVF